MSKTNTFTTAHEAALAGLHPLVASDQCLVSSPLCYIDGSHANQLHKGVTHGIHAGTQRHTGFIGGCGVQDSRGDRRDEDGGFCCGQCAINRATANAKICQLFAGQYRQERSHHSWLLDVGPDASGPVDFSEEVSFHTDATDAAAAIALVSAAVAAESAALGLRARHAIVFFGFISSRLCRGGEFGVLVRCLRDHSFEADALVSERVEIAHPIARHTLSPLRYGAQGNAEMFGNSLCAAFFGIEPGCEVHAVSLEISKRSVKPKLNLVALYLAIA